MLSRHTYLPYGEELTPANFYSEVMRFIVHERDFDPAGWGNDLDSMHVRFYSPRVGAFLSLDPILGQAERPLSWNRYAYVLGNPIGLVDPDGEYAESPLDLTILAGDLLIATFEVVRDGEVSGTTKAAITADLLTLATPGLAGGGLFVLGGAAAVRTAQSAEVGARGLQAATKAAQLGQVAFSEGERGGGDGSKASNNFQSLR